MRDPRLSDHDGAITQRHDGSAGTASTRDEGATMLEYQLHRHHARDLIAEMTEVRSAQRLRRARRSARAAASAPATPPARTADRAAAPAPSSGRLRRALRIA